MKKIVVHGARLVQGGVMLTNEIVEQLRGMGVDIVREPIGLGARRQALLNGTKAGAVLVAEFELLSSDVVGYTYKQGTRDPGKSNAAFHEEVRRATCEAFGVKFVSDPNLPPDEAHVVQNGKIVGRIIDIEGS